MVEPDAVARRAHYADFYGSRTTARCDDLLLVHGNCQAESLRVALDGPDVRTVRVPPVHELVADDVEHLHRLLAAARCVVTQPVRAGYHGLAVGTADVLRAAPRARAAVVPVVRVAGLYPTQLIVRPRADPSLSPPVVPYHDARTLAEAATGRPADGRRLTGAQVRAVAERSQRELRRRERDHGTVVVADVLDRPRFEHARTLNHPGNPVFVALAERVRATLGLPPTTSGPDRELLDGLHAPRLPEVVQELGLDDEPTDHWRTVAGVITEAEVREEHLRWYAARPDVVADALERHGDLLRELRLV